MNQFDFIARLWKGFAKRIRDIAIAFVLLLLLALLITYAAARFPVLSFDSKSYEELQEQASPLFDGLMRGVSALGERQSLCLPQPAG